MTETDDKPADGRRKDDERRTERLTLRVTKTTKNTVIEDAQPGESMADTVTRWADGVRDGGAS